MKQFNNIQSQLLSLSLASLTAFLLIGLFIVTITGINLLPLPSHILLKIFPIDILVGITIYLKTSIDFALFTGNLMTKFQGFKNQLAIEIGTAFGNGLGTLFVLLVWTFFKEIPLLLFCMIVLAALVLLGLAQESIENYFSTSPHLPEPFFSGIDIFRKKLKKITTFLAPLLRLLTPRAPTINASGTTIASLFFFALTIPFVLGLDDFAGYIPLFSIIHIFGFCVGVILGHLLLTLSLFAFPNKTRQLVRFPLIQLFGSLIFTGLSLFGIFEAVRMITPFIATVLQK